MTLRLYNTLTRTLEELKPIQAGRIGLYTCGPTVYDSAHIGNLRTFMFEDLLKRYLQYSGYQVTHVMNITDVDDKTIRRAIDEGVSLSGITERYTREFLDDLDTLAIIRADHLPRATEYISKIVSAIETLIAREHAYVTDDGSVFFAVGSFAEYGRLARLDPDQLVAGERIADDTYDKAEARDFALWKAAKPEDKEHHWPSPWGPGRPGWHMECSIMSTELLSDHFDIHCGGVDNIFPHHENEIAQSRCLHDGPFVNMWLHSEHLIVDGKKMSKSLGNFYTLQDLLDKGMDPMVLRYVLLSTHYRQKLNFTDDRITASQSAINRLREVVRRLNAVPRHAPDWVKHEAPDPRFMAALDNDLNISKALAVMFGWVGSLFGRMDEQRLGYAEAQAALDTLKVYDRILGVIFVEEQIGADIQALIKQREQARRERNWALADELRDELAQGGILLEDTPSGTIWKRK